jgi:hypothetical protein
MDRCVVALLALAAALPASGENLLSNTSFDSDVAGWTPPTAVTWIANDGNPNGSGPGCAEASTDQANGGLWGAWETVDVTAGTTYTVAGWTLVPSGGGNIADSGEYSVGWYAGATYLSTSFFSGVRVRDQWTYRTDRVTAPSGATQAQVEFGVRAPYPGSGLSRARWDDVYFGPPQTQAPTVDAFVLAAGYGPGKNGTFWTTDVSIYNPTSATLQIEGTFFTGPGDNSGAAAASLGSIAPGATISIPAIVQAAGGSGTGAVRLRFTAPSDAPGAAAVVTARTWTPFGGATLGQGATASAGPSGVTRAVTGLVQNAAFRTNVGVFNATGQTVNALVQIYDAAGTPLYVQTWTLGPFGQFQVGLPNLGINSLEGGTMRVAGPGIIAYATPVDNVNGDAAYLEARTIQ